MGLPGSTSSPPKAFDLHPGDRFYAFTDGIVEASDPEGEEFGLKNLIQCFDEFSIRPVQQTLGKIYEVVAEHTQIQDQQDDITLLGLELKA